MIIDFHTHCYPDAVAAHAMAAMTGAAEACPEASGLRPEGGGAGLFFLCWGGGAPYGRGGPPRAASGQRFRAPPEYAGVHSFRDTLRKARSLHAFQGFDHIDFFQPVIHQQIDDG